jgi:hypothetical protein
MQDVRARFSGWTAPSKPVDAAPPLEIPRRSGPVVLVTAQANATQARLHLACLAPGKTEVQELSNKVAANLLGATLFDTIRGELGASYGIHGSARMLADGTSRLDWEGSIENGRLGQALGVVRRLTEGFATEALTEQAIGRARWEVAREATMLDSSTELVARVLTQRVMLGRSTEEGAKTFDVLAGVGKPQLEEVWRSCRGSTVLSLVGDEAVIREALQTAGY